jgi:hypothetical protein
MRDIWQKPEIITWSQIILNSYQQLLGKELINRNGNPREEAKQLFYAPMIVLSHNSDPDPLYNYANLQGLKLWEMTWEELITTPSKSTTEPILREKRDKFLAETTTKGYITNYQGIRVSRTGKKYKIKDVIVWNLTNEEDQYCGQGATFSRWECL